MTQPNRIDLLVISLLKCGYHAFELPCAVRNKRQISINCIPFHIRTTYGGDLQILSGEQPVALVKEQLARSILKERIDAILPQEYKLMSFFNKVFDTPKPVNPKNCTTLQQWWQVSESGEHMLEVAGHLGIKVYNHKKFILAEALVTRTSKDVFELRAQAMLALAVRYGNGENVDKQYLITELAKGGAPWAKPMSQDASYMAAFWSKASHSLEHQAQVDLTNANICRDILTQEVAQFYKFFDK